MKKIILNIICLLSIFTFFKPDYFVGVGSSLNLVFNIFRILIIVIGLFIFFKNIKTNNISKLSLVLILFYFILLFSTFLNNNSTLMNEIFNAIFTISFCYIVEAMTKYNAKSFFKIGYIYLFILALINIYTIFRYPNGMWISSAGYWQNWFLGYDNNHINTLFPLLIFGYLYDITKFNKLKFNYLLAVLLVLLTFIKTWSVTSLVGIILFIMYLIIIDNKRKAFNLTKYLKYYIIVFLVIVMFRFQNILSYLVINVLKKDLTFSGRTKIWDYVMKYITKKPILGYGIQDSNVRYHLSSFNPSYHAHNLLLELLYRGGIILLICFLWMIKIVQNKLKNNKSRIAMFASAIIIIYSIMLLGEFFDPSNFLYLLILFNCIEFINKEAYNG